MNFVIVDVDTKRKEYPDMTDSKQAAEVNSRLLTVGEYQSLARRIIGKWAPPGFRNAMLNSEDAIDFVAHRIMLGDWDYDPTRSAIETRRGYCGKKAIQSYVDKLCEENSRRHAEEMDDDNDDGRLTPPLEKLMGDEERINLRRYLEMVLGCLTPTQRACIVMRHVDEMSNADIARLLGITREGVRQALLNGMRRLRKLVGVKRK
jgi:RNA polymerase sigma factor (sigma-70 family)